MQVERYRIVLTGWTMSGRNTQDVVAELSRLFKIPESRIRPLLIGEPSIIRRDLTLERAEHLRNKIEQRGAACRLKRVVRDEAQMRPPSRFDHTGFIEPDLNMESTQFILTEDSTQGGIRLRPGYFSHQDLRHRRKGPSRQAVLLLGGVVLLVVLLLYLFLV